MADFLPQGDLPYDVWFTTFLLFVSANQALLGLSVAEVADLTAAHTAWQAALAAHQAAQVAAAAAADDKDDARAAATGLIRPMAGKLQDTAIVTDGMREAMGLTVPDREPTRLSGEVILNTPAPLLLLSNQERGEIRCHFGEHPSNERENKKPFGMAGAVIWYAVGGIPTVDDAAGPWQLVAMDTNSPYTHVVPATEAVKLAYKAQWQDRLGRYGPFSDPVVIALTPAP